MNRATYRYGETQKFYSLSIRQNSGKVKGLRKYFSKLELFLL
jgi:hypothetical protein